MLVTGPGSIPGASLPLNPTNFRRWSLSSSYSDIVQLYMPLFTSLMLCSTVGPCMTDMFQSIIDTSHSTSVREVFQGQVDRGEVLSCQQSISRLVKLLKDNSYENAAVIDYYDP